MRLRLFPQPTNEDITPYLQAEEGVYRCLDECGVVRQVSLRGDDVVVGDDDERRLPDRDRVLDWAQSATATEFAEFVRTTHVVPTFSRNQLEALVRVVARQIVTRVQARHTIANLIREYGLAREGLHGFPSESRMLALKVDDFVRLGLGFRSERLADALAMCSSGHSPLGARMSGIGPWSRAVLEADLRKDFRFYPMWDKSGESAGRALGIALEDLRRSDPVLAADLYVYGLSWLEAESDAVVRLAAAVETE